jgi:hypothetical protein
VATRAQQGPRRCRRGGGGRRRRSRSSSRHRGVRLAGGRGLHGASRRSARTSPTPSSRTGWTWPRRSWTSIVMQVLGVQRPKMSTSIRHGGQSISRASSTRPCPSPRCCGARTGSACSTLAGCTGCTARARAARRGWRSSPWWSSWAQEAVWRSWTSRTPPPPSSSACGRWEPTPASCAIGTTSAMCAPRRRPTTRTGSRRPPLRTWTTSWRGSPSSSSSTASRRP